MAKKISPTLDRRSKMMALATGFACAMPLMLLVPSWLAASLFGASATSVALAWKRPVSWYLRLLSTGSMVVLVFYAYEFRVGRDTASAMLLAMLMLKPIELNTLRDARSLIGFGLFSLFSALLLDQGPLTLLLAAPASILAFGTCARLADAEVGTFDRGFNLKRVLAIGALFLLASPLAMAGFWLFPRLGSPLWGIPNVAKAKVGIGDNMAPGEWLDVLTDDSPAFRARFLGPTPPQDKLYWRGIVMWNFDGRTWTQWEQPRTMPPARLLPLGTPIRYEISLEPTDKRYLFALDVPLLAPDDASMGGDQTMISDQPISSLRSYSMTSAVPARFEPDLEPGIREAALRLPDGYNPRSIALARQWRSQSRNDEQVVRRALEMYRASFSYSLAAPALGHDSIDEFLFTTKIGFCEHFSSSFTFLMRAAGIPARVVTGYVGGYQNRLGKFLLVRQQDAHAWSEVWLKGRGWTRVDPTAAVAPERVFLREAQSAAGTGAGTTFGQLLDVGDWMRNGWNDLVLRFDAERQQLLLSSLGVPHANRNDLVIAFAVTAGLLLFGIAFWQLRDRGPRPDALLRAWSRFTKRLARARLQKLPHEPALAYARRIAPLLAAQHDEMLSLSERFASARYAREAMDDPARRALIHDLRAFRVRTG